MSFPREKHNKKNQQAEVEADFPDRRRVRERVEKKKDADKPGNALV